MLKVIISGGGTGGHIYPGIAIAKALQELKPEIRILFVGGKGKRESMIIPRYGFDFVPILVEGFPRSLSLKWFVVLSKVFMGFIKSLIVLQKFKPMVVIGTGGYVCGPVLLGALLLNIPFVIQEQNAIPGITNRILGRWADRTYVPFQVTTKFFPSFRAQVVGNPVRPEILTKKETREKLGLDKDKLTISFLGGSQGARTINLAVISALKCLEGLETDIQMIHQTGESDFSIVKSAYDRSPFLAVVQPYFHSIEEIYSATDLAVCRSGAMTLAELTARGIPAILIPYPFAAGDHQTFNAKVLEKNGAALIIRNDELSGERLAEVIKSLIEDRNRLSYMAQMSGSLGRPESAHEIAKSILSLVRAMNTQSSSSFSKGG